MSILNELQTLMEDSKSVILSRYDINDFERWNELLADAGYITRDADGDNIDEVVAYPSKNVGVPLNQTDFTNHAIRLGILESLGVVKDSFKDFYVTTRINMTKEEWYTRFPKEPKLLDN